MMGSTKLSTIRAEVRKAFKMSDAELAAWFQRQIEDREQGPKANRRELQTLQLLRDALLREVKRGAPRRKTRRLSGRAKT